MLAEAEPFQSISTTPIRVQALNGHNRQIELKVLTAELPPPDVSKVEAWVNRRVILQELDRNRTWVVGLDQLLKFGTYYGPHGHLKFVSIFSEYPGSDKV